MYIISIRAAEDAYNNRSNITREKGTTIRSKQQTEAQAVEDTTVKQFGSQLMCGADGLAASLPALLKMQRDAIS